MVIIQTNMIIIVINKRYLINKIDENQRTITYLISLISIPSYQGMSRFGKHTSQRLFMKRKEIFT